MSLQSLKNENSRMPEAKSQELQQCLQMNEEYSWKVYKDAYECPARQIINPFSSEEWTNDQKYLYIERPLTAAVLLNDQSIIEKSINDGPIVMSPGLESAIAFLPEKECEMFIRKYESLAAQIRLSAIYEARSIPLLRYYSRRYTKDDKLKELRTYLSWLDEKKKRNEKIRRRLYVQRIDDSTEDFRFFKIFMHVYYMKRKPDMMIVKDIQRRLLEYLKVEILKESAKKQIPLTNLNWDDLNSMDELNVSNCVEYFMLLTKKYGSLDITEQVYDFMMNSVYVLDMLRLRYGIKKNFVVLNQYKAKMPENDSEAKIMQGEWIKRLMRYAVPAELREETDPITEWLIRRNDSKLIKYAIRQNYIGRQNAGRLREYALLLEDHEIDSQIMELLTREMRGK